LQSVIVIQQPTLMIRTAVLPGESLPSLFIRLARLNYYGTPDTLSQILREGVGEQVFLKDRVVLPQRAETYQRLTNLTGIRIPDLYAASAHHFAAVLTPPDHPMKFLETGGDITGPLLAPALATKQLRPAHAGQFCPICLKNAGYHRLIWMPILASACLEHSCLFIDRCQQCNKSVSIREIVEARCRKCKGKLTETGVTFLGDDMGLLFQRIFQSWFMRNTTSSAANLFLPKQQPGVLYRVIDGLQWAARMLIDLKWPYLHLPSVDSQDLTLEQCREQRVITPCESYRLYITAGKGIMNWPEGFYEFLDAYRSQMQHDKPLNGGPKADLGNLYTQWLQDYWRHPAFEFVHKAFEHYFTNTYSLSSAVMRSYLCQDNPVISEQFSHVNVAEAARLLGTTPKMINALLRAGKLTCLALGLTGKRKYQFMNRAEVLEFRKRWNESVNRAETAEWLGITERMVIDLVKVGLLVAERNPGEGFPHWAFSKSALVDCLEKVLKCVKNYPYQRAREKDSLLDLAGAAHLLFVAGLNAASILLCVAEGKLQAYYNTDHNPKLASLLFNRPDIQQLIQLIKSENGWISRKDVTKLLRVKDVTLTRWVKFGLISPAVICGSVQYFDREIVEEFIADHITTEEAAKILGVGKLTLQKWTRQERLSSACISGPYIDGYHSYIFHKGKLVQWRRERLTFGEAVQLLDISKATLHRWVEEGKVEALDDMGGKQRWFSKQAILEL
jgi:hypothetical protein